MNTEIVLRNKITSNHPIDRVVMQQLIWAYSHTETTLTMTEYCNNELQRIGHKKVVRISSIMEQLRNTKGQFSTTSPKPHLMRVSESEKAFIEKSRMTNTELRWQLEICWACPTNNYVSCQKCPDTTF